MACRDDGPSSIACTALATYVKPTLWMLGASAASTPADPQARQARGVAGSAADQIPVGDQPQNRQGVGPHHSAAAARHRRRGDRSESCMHISNGTSRRFANALLTSGSELLRKRLGTSAPSPAFLERHLIAAREPSSPQVYPSCVSKKLRSKNTWGMLFGIKSCSSD